MIQKILSIVVTGWLSCTSMAQITIRGIATKINSSFTPIPGVEIIIDGGVPTTTDNAGAFTLHLPDYNPGDELFNIRINKDDMEIVNIKEIEQWVATEDILYKIILCPKGYLEESKRIFYNAGKSYYQKEYEKKIKELKNTYKKQQHDIKVFEIELARLNDEYEKHMKLLKYYSEKFARINKDELSNMEKEAISRIEIGDIDGAIQIYEQSGIIKHFDIKIQQLDSINQSLRIAARLLKQQINWYNEEGSPISIKKSDTLKITLNKIMKRLEE